MDNIVEIKKEEYESSEIEVITFGTEDIIITSNIETPDDNLRP